MQSIRKWFYKPKKEDSSKLAQFYWADEELTMVATELDSFDGRTDPDRCSILVSQLRVCQDKVLGICSDIMDEAIPDMRANRDYRAKFPDDVLHENLAGQLWFGAECLAAGSNIMNRELESSNMRPLAKALTRALDNVRCLLREQSLRNPNQYCDKVKEALRIFDRLFCEFELSYVSAMVPIKSAKEYHVQQEIIVLFSETLLRALKMDLVSQEMIDDYDPSLMFTIPRLAIVWGLLIYTEGPLNVEGDPSEMSELFRPFYNLLVKIRDLLWTLTRNELHALEKMLCSFEEPKIVPSTKLSDENVPFSDSECFINMFYQTHRNCKQFVQDFYAHNFGLLLGDGNACHHSYTDGSIRESFRMNGNNCNKQIEVNNEKVENESISLSSDVQEEFSTTANATDIEDCKPSQSYLEKTDSGELCENLSSIEKNFDRTVVESESLSVFEQCETQLDVDSLKKLEIAKHEHNQKVSPVKCSLEKLNDESDGILSSEKSVSSPQEPLCLEKCLCELNTSSNDERISPMPRSLASLAQMMRQSGLVLPNYASGYSSSSNINLPANQISFLSHSFPVNATELSLSRERHSSAHNRRQRTTHNRLEHFSHLHCNFPYSHSMESQVNSLCSCTRQQRILSDQCTPCVNSCISTSKPLTIPRVQQLKDVSTRNHQFCSSCSSCQSIPSISESEWNSSSPETSSYNSECQDDEEIALALQAVEIASHNKARARFKSSDDLLHKLFVCISGVADQLQTNYASDLRNILKGVFDINCSQNISVSREDSHTSCSEDRISPFNSFSSNPIEPNPVECQDSEQTPTIEERSEFLQVETNVEVPNSDNQKGFEDDERDHSSVDSAEEVIPDRSPTPSIESLRDRPETLSCDFIEDPPAWLPDDTSDHCMACKVHFTLLRRRHHCRNCGKIFCSRCSSNSIPLPRYGHLKPVRVCNHCFMYQLTSLMVQQQL